jgi:hypothetical protein
MSLRTEMIPVTSAGAKMPLDAEGVEVDERGAVEDGGFDPPDSARWSTIMVRNSIWLAVAGLPWRNCWKAALAAARSRPTRERTKRPSPSLTF